MDITDIIAFFAFIVALYGAILSTYTAINEIILNNKYIINSSCKFDTLLPTDFTNNNGTTISWKDKTLQYPPIKPLLEIKPLTSYEGYLIFNNVGELPSKFDITVNTVQKSKNFHLKLSIANDYRNSITQE